MLIRISDLTKHNALIWPKQPDIVWEPTHPNIFLGGGVATKDQISLGVPFDMLGFMLTAEQLRRITRGQVHMLIADQHAWLANSLDSKQAIMAATQLHKIVGSIITNFQLPNWKIHIASQVFPNTLPNSYEALETRDITHFATHHQVGVKVSWTFSPKVTGITDESHFDTLYNLSTVIIKPGLTNDPTKPHESLYICTNPSYRITFTHLNNWDISPRVKNHLHNICLLFEKLLEPFPSKTPLQIKVEQIIKSIV